MTVIKFNIINLFIGSSSLRPCRVKLSRPVVNNALNYSHVSVVTTMTTR